LSSKTSKIFRFLLAAGKIRFKLRSAEGNVKFAFVLTKPQESSNLIYHIGLV